MRTYELTLIIDAQLAPETQEEVIAKFLDVLKAQNVEIVNIEKWGKKKLAYPISDHQYGHYLMTQFNATVEVIPQIEHYLKLSPNILRYLLLYRDKKTMNLMTLESERRAREATISAEQTKEIVVENGPEVEGEESVKLDDESVKLDDDSVKVDDDKTVSDQENKIDEEI
jgi:small subunit ribosomal protein S6